MKVEKLCEYTESHYIIHCEKGNTIVCELYSNKTVILKIYT